MPGGHPGGSRPAQAEPTLAQQLAMQIVGGTAGFLSGRATTMAVKSVSAVYLGRDNKNRPVYRVSFLRAGNNQRVTQTVSWDGRTVRPPSLSATAREGGIGDPSRISGGGTRTFGDVGAMSRSKDNAMAWLATNSTKLAATDVTALTRAIHDWSGTDPGAFHDWWAMTRRNLPALTGVGVQDFAFDDSLLFGGGGGGGGGFAGPEYRAPDKRVVEDFVKGSLISLVGTIPEQYVGTFTELFMRDHRKNFDSLDREIDPQQSVTEAIRRTQEYKTVHQLRPQGEDERDWVSQRRQQGERGGLQTDLDQFAINQATVGGDLGDVERAGATQQFQKSGKMPTLLDNQFRSIAESMMSRVAR